jgi:metal-sulfur cluster biosynthetic enzyme
MNLIDKIIINGNSVIVEFHLSMPWCPGMFAMQIAKDIRKVVSEMKDVKKTQIKLKDHYMEDQINKEVNE